MTALSSAFGYAAKQRKKDSGGDSIGELFLKHALIVPAAQAVGETVQSAGKSLFGGPDLWETEGGNSIAKAVKYTEDNISSWDTEYQRMVREGKGSAEDYLYNRRRDYEQKLLEQQLVGIQDEEYKKQMIAGYLASEEDRMRKETSDLHNEYLGYKDGMGNRASSLEEVARRQKMGDHYFNQPTAARWLSRLNSKYGFSKKTLAEKQRDSMKYMIFGPSGVNVSPEEFDKYMKLETGKTLQNTLRNFSLKIENAESYEKASKDFFEANPELQERVTTASKRRATKTFLTPILETEVENMGNTERRFLEERFDGKVSELATWYSNFSTIQQGHAAYSRLFTEHVLKDSILQDQIKLNSQQYMGQATISLTDDSTVSLTNYLRTNFSLVRTHGDEDLQEYNTYDKLRAFAIDGSTDKHKKAQNHIDKINQQTTDFINTLGTTQFVADLTTALDSIQESSEMLTRQDLGRAAVLYLDHQVRNNTDFRDKTVIPAKESRFLGYFDTPEKVMYGNFGLKDREEGSKYLVGLLSNKEALQEQVNLFQSNTINNNLEGMRIVSEQNIVDENQAKKLAGYTEPNFNANEFLSDSRASIDSVTENKEIQRVAIVALMEDNFQKIIARAEAAGKIDEQGYPQINGQLIGTFQKLEQQLNDAYGIEQPKQWTVNRILDGYTETSNQEETTKVAEKGTIGYIRGQSTELPFLSFVDKQYADWDELNAKRGKAFVTWQELGLDAKKNYDNNFRVYFKSWLANEESS